ncbi:unnamed protein product [Symbiodinium microadriaticum]|nr:unnamed protein product [Symbiodinium microadriaticum]
MNEEDAEQESKSSRALDDRPKYQGKRNNIVVVLGMPGSGLLSVAAQVHARVSAEYEKDSLKVLVLDINDANVEDNILHLSQSARSASRPVVIAIIDSALKRIPITAIYTRFSDNGCDICCCITVLSLPGDKNIWKRNGRTQFLGVETWSAATRNGLRAGHDFERNVVVFVESDQSGSKRRFHEELETFNPSATSVTVRPQFLWLDVEIMNTIFDACRSNVKQVRYPAVDVKDFPKSSQMPSSLRSLSSVDVVLAAGAVSYERVTILLTTLFPGAVISNTLAQHSSQLPANIKGLTGIQLGLMLAKIKVFSKRHHDLAMRDFQAVIDACDCDTLCALQASILSAHAILGRGVQSHVDGALFEATPDTLIARPLGESYHTTNTITLMGCFRPADVSVLRRLFEQCVIPPVQVRRHLEPVNVRSDTHKTAAQRMFGHLPVPSGWWYDGSSYVDMHGSRLSNRPDIDTLLDLYLIEKNKEVDMFNNMLHEVTPFIQNVD